MKKNIVKKGIITGVIILFIGASLGPSIAGNSFGNEKNIPINNEIELDVDYIYSIVQNLSDIIFTEYNESAGEIAKGRSFGTKGEHKAAQILYENMTMLGLITTLEQINNTEKYPTLTHGYVVLDYGLTLKNNSSGINESVDCWISAVEPGRQLAHEETFTFEEHELKIRRIPKNFKELKEALAYDKTGEEYVFLSDIRGGLCREPNPTLPWDLALMRKFFYPIRVFPSIVYTNFRRKLEQWYLDNFFNNCKGKIAFDFTNDTHDASSNNNVKLVPAITMNGTICRKIDNDIDNYTVDFFVNETYNKSIVSYNVIGLLEGKDPSKTILVDCLYDSVWCQGTGDSGVGMGIVMGIAKYYSDNNITPKYNIKFIGFGGEETGCRGAKYYEATHKDENITYIIDMNQVCSSQEDPPLTLNLLVNNLGFILDIMPIVKKSNYAERVGNTDIKIRWCPLGAPSDDGVFVRERSEVKSVCFLEDFPWVMHHRDGVNHTEGDVFKHVDWNEVKVTSELVLNITKHVTL